DQLWTLTQNYMHAHVEWKLYDLSGVQHVTAKDKEIFMLVEKDYPLRKGLALVMISYRLQVENHSQMAEDLIRKIYNIANTPSQTNEKTGLGYNSHVFTRAMFDCDDYLSSESEESWPPSSLYDRFQPSDGYHDVPIPYTGTFMPPKPDLVFNTVPTAVETDHFAFNVHLSLTKPNQDLSHTNRPTAPIIEDWVFDSEDKFKTKLPQIVSSFIQSTEQVKSLRHSVQHVETSIPAATPKSTSPKPTSNGNRMNRKACFVCKSLDHLLKDCDYHRRKWLNPLLGTMHTGSKPVPITVVRPVCTVVPNIKVTRPKQVKPIITNFNSPNKRHITRSPSPNTSNSPLRVTTIKAPMGNPQHALKDKGVIDSECSREDLNQLWALVKEYISIRPASSDKEMEVWVELKRMYEPDPEDQQWTLTQNYMHAPVEWKLYDLHGVHHVTAKDKEIFMLVEKDYPLRRGLALVMISYRLQVENHSQMAEDLIKKIYNIANTPRKQRESFHWQYKFPLSVKVVPTARRLKMPLSGVCTAIEEMMKKLPVKDRWQLH
nr:hypothetical protein [Tanacetum cinerariifolium]